MGSMIYPLIILAILGVVYGILRWRGINMFSFLNGSVMDLFKIAGMVGAVIEVLSLSELAITRGINPVTAYGRYSMLALVETLLGFWFITAMTESFYEKMKDGYITVYEVTKTLIGVSWIFYLSYFITGNIWITYLESQGRVELQQVYISMLNSVRGIHVETNPANFEFNDQELTPIEYGAWGSIYISVLFNFLAMPYLLRKHWNQFRIVDPQGPIGRRLYNNAYLYGNTDAYISNDELKRMNDDDKAKYQGKATKPSGSASPGNTGSTTINYAKYVGEVSNNGTALSDYGKFLTTMFDIKADDFKNFIFEYCGRNFDNGTNMPTSNVTYSKVKDSSVTADEALVKLTESLVTKAGYGLKELYNKAKEIADEMVTVSKMKESMAKLEIEIDKTTEPGSRSVKVKEWTNDHDKYKTFVDKLEALIGKFKNSVSPFANSLQSMNYPTSYNKNKNPFDSDFRLLKSYVLTVKS